VEKVTILSGEIPEMTSSTVMKAMTLFMAGLAMMSFMATMATMFSTVFLEMTFCGVILATIAFMVAMASMSFTAAGDPIMGPLITTIRVMTRRVRLPRAVRCFTNSRVLL